MNFTNYYLGYSLIAIVYFIRIVVRSEKRFFVALIAFWILSTPILNRDEYLIQTPWGYDLQPLRLFLVFGLLSLAFSTLYDFLLTKKINFKLVPYEFFILAYVLVSSVVIIVTAPDFRAMLPIISAQIIFPVMYFVARNHLTPKDIRRLENLLIVFGCLSVLVSIVQFFFAADFFRLTTQRTAFGIFFRANGFMLNENDNGLLLACLTALVLTRKGFNLKIFLAAWFSLGVFLTMHRGSWVIYLLTLCLYFLVKATDLKKYSLRLVTFWGTFLLLGAVLFFLIYPYVVPRSLATLTQDFISGRLTEETLTIRMDLTSFGLDIIVNQPLGIGDFGFPAYWQLYRRTGLPLNYGNPFAVHNGFIAAAVTYGVVGGLFFALLPISIIAFWIQQKQKYASARLKIVLVCVAFVVMNLTQDLAILGSFPVIVIAFFLGTSRASIIDGSTAAAPTSFISRN
jgi:hypothetical protein